jgi:hypothetical protein
MRWRHTPPPPSVEGAKRTREGFLWLPRRIGDETRWMEPARWEQEVGKLYKGECWYLGWVDTRWLPDFNPGDQYG